MFSNLKEDLQVFSLVHNEPGILKYLYYPDCRVVILYRLGHWLYRFRYLRFFAYFCTLLNDFFHGVWIGPHVTIGPGVFFGHPRGLVINPSTKIGHHCSILHRVTIGGPNVVIGNNVEINSAVSVVSNSRGKRRLNIGNNVVIGAGAVVVDDIADNCLVVGVPARKIRDLPPEENWISRRKEQVRKETENV